MEEQKQSTSSNYFKGLSRRDYIQKAHEIIQQKGFRQYLPAGLLRSGVLISKSVQVL